MHHSLYRPKTVGSQLQAGTGNMGAGRDIDGPPDVAKSAMDYET